ncbi:putative Bacterial general secretion pathway protein H [uncultured Pleomorphomonas sp.]|uniref:Putative Bacterial general secretion pathway protein H n=1 Tax=uncultured Pleomorphomonas sp. TaxID=442121 RepID=A0A212LMD3_9HYPH|nr:OpgC domain-containing protein [uncultured Pleomorphomonas sp.]SCM78684.1 putative Bacterial general secretion pathway protein H [uncultured Pleomorphomonas sp.]
MNIKPLGKRDHRIDILRALALLSIFINHIPGNVLEPYTHKNFGLSDSAEAFVLLAGVASAFAYFPRFYAGAVALPLAKIAKRVVVLYVAHIASLMVGLGIFCFALQRWGMPILNTPLNIDTIYAEPTKAFIGIPLMTQQIGYHNILPLYVCLLIFLPVLMVVARFFGLGAMLATSVATYAAAHVFGLNMPAYPGNGGWFFNPFTWQLIFGVGFFTGVRVLRGETPVPFFRPLWWLALAYLIAACVYHRYNLYGSIPEVSWLPHNFQINEKPWVALPRLLHILSLAYVIGHSRLIMGWLGRLSPEGVLSRIGRNSLPVFWLGTALSVVGQVVLFADQPGPVEQIAFIAVGITAQAALAYFLDYLGKASKAKAAPKAVPEPAAAGKDAMAA